MLLEREHPNPPAALGLLMATTESVRSARGEDPRERLEELFATLRPHFAALDAMLEQQLGSFEPEIRELAHYCLTTGGKRIRPALVFFSGWEDPSAVSQDLVRVAAVIEMVHLATLVHDDIMDKADVRRGRTTASRRFGPDTAVLLGDALFAHALTLAAEFPTTEVCRHVSGSTRKVCAGEIMQTLAAADTVRDRAYYQRVIELKTAELFFVSCFLGARLAGASEPIASSAGEFGRRLGTAYQMYDDIADCFGTEARFGKTLGTDLASGKATLPVLLLLDSLPPDDADRLRIELQNHDTSKLAERIAQMRQLGIFERCLAAMHAELESAFAHLADFETPAAPLLRRLAELLLKQAETLQP